MRNITKVSNKPITKQTSKNQNTPQIIAKSKRQIPKKKIIITVVAFMFLVIIITVSFIICPLVFRQKASDELTINTASIQPIKLSYIKKQSFDSYDLNHVLHKAEILYINDFALSIAFSIVDVGYSFKINDNVVQIKSNDDKYEYYMIQLDSKLYTASSLLSKSSYEDLTILARKTFGINFNKFSDVFSSCYNNDCTHKLLQEYKDGISSVVHTYTRAAADKNQPSSFDKKYYGSYLVYEKYKGALQTNYIDFESDIMMN